MKVTDCKNARRKPEINVELCDQNIFGIVDLLLLFKKSASVWVV